LIFDFALITNHYSLLIMEASAIAKKMIGKTYSDVRPGDTVRVFERVKEGDKTRVARFEGMVTARKHGNEPGASITVRKISYGVGVERLFPLGSPFIEKIEVIKRSKVRRANLNFLRKRTGKAATLKGELVPPVTGSREQEEAVTIMENAAEEMPRDVVGEESAETTQKPTVEGTEKAPM